MLPQPVTPLMKWRSRFREMDEGLVPLQGNEGCVEGAVKGGRNPANRTLEGPLNADTLQGLGLVADFRSRPPSPSGGEDFPALGGGVRGWGKRRGLPMARVFAKVSVGSQTRSRRGGGRLQAEQHRPRTFHQAFLGGLADGYSLLRCNAR